MAQVRPALVCALGILLLAPQTAEGGGWWSYIDVSRSTVVPGQRVVVNEDVAFSSAAAAEEARETDPFYVYLLRDFDHGVVERAMRSRFGLGRWPSASWVRTSAGHEPNSPCPSSHPRPTT